MTNNGYENVNSQIDGSMIGLAWLEGITYWKTDKAVVMNPHRHPHAELIFCLKGSLTYLIGTDRTVTLGEGNGVVVPANTLHVLQGGIDSPCERLGFHLINPAKLSCRYRIFSPADLKRIKSTLLAHAATPFRPDQSALASLRELAAILRRTDNARDAALLRILSADLLYRTAATLSKPLIAPEPHLMDAAVRFLDDHYAEKINFDDLANHMGYGRTQLFKLFKAHTGLTPNEYLIRRRIDRAGQLLADSSRSTAEIASLTGFNSAAYLRKVYLKYTGRKHPYPTYS